MRTINTSNLTLNQLNIWNLICHNGNIAKLSAPLGNGLHHSINELVKKLQVNNTAFNFVNVRLPQVDSLVEIIAESITDEPTLICLDDLHSATESVQKFIFSLIETKTINGFKIPDNFYIVVLSKY